MVTKLISGLFFLRDSLLKSDVSGFGCFFFLRASLLISVVSKFNGGGTGWSFSKLTSDFRNFEKEACFEKNPAGTVSRESSTDIEGLGVS